SGAKRSEGERRSGDERPSLCDTRAMMTYQVLRHSDGKLPCPFAYSARATCSDCARTVHGPVFFRGFDFVAVGAPPMTKLPAVWVQRISVSVKPGVNAASISMVAAPGGTEISRKRKRVASRIAATTHSGGMFSAEDHEGNATSFSKRCAIGVSMTPGMTRPPWIFDVSISVRRASLSAKRANLVPQ